MSRLMVTNHRTSNRNVLRVFLFAIFENNRVLVPCSPTQLWLYQFH